MDTSVQKYRALLETVRLGSFTRAAHSLNYTQSGISRMIAELEQNWGVRLLERGRGGVRLTTDGEDLLPFVRQACEDDDALRDKVMQLKGFEGGRISMGVISSVATHWLPKVILMFREIYPSIEYDLQIGSHSEIERWVEDGGIDFGILRNPHNPRLETFHIEDDEFAVIMPLGHEMAALDEFPISRLGEFPIFTFKRNNDEETQEIFRAYDVHVEPKITTLDEYAIMALVESGMGIGLLSRLMLTRHPYDIAVRPLDVHPSREIVMVMRDRARTSLVNRRFIDFLAKRWDMRL